MYPSSSSARSHPWQEESPEPRYPQPEAAAYLTREQQSGYPPHPREGPPPPPNGFHPDQGRWEGNLRYPSEHIGPASQQTSQLNTQGVPQSNQQPPQESLNAENMAGEPWNRAIFPNAQQFNQPPAPRQRTAIACRYCRRRKIRCSGFETSPDGRCSNCQRFNQECIFTPVSSQAQAFVPVHTQYPGMRQIPGGRPVAGRGYPPGSVQLYGAHGQPLGVASPADYAPQPPSHMPHGRSSSPASSRPPGFDELDPYGERSDNHPPILPPLPRRSSQGDYPTHWNRPDAGSVPILPPPRGFSPPNPAQGSPAGYGGSAPGHLPYTDSARRSPPFSIERPPSSISPSAHIHPPMWPGPPRPESAGPNPMLGSSPHQRHPQLSALINQPQQRSAHDSEMLDQLRRAL